ncbi:MAG: sortase [Candidatus Paceibacterota bacterium]
MDIKFLKIINKILLVVILLLGIYIILAPFLPQIFNLYTTVDNINISNNKETQSVNLQNAILTPASYKDDGSNNITEIDEDIDTSLFQIQINSINLDSKLISSTTNKDLWKGIWHRSNTGNPIQGGNMVITAHRFLYTGNNNTFYRLPNIKMNEIITLYWEGIKYDYRVYDIFEVTPDAVEIEKNTDKHILTLYTCTPLWTSAKRFVVRATPLF